MKHNYTVSTIPDVAICNNKSRRKLYKESLPTYYLNNGEEFTIELFNPLSETILAKIEINGKLISQSGLILRPGERVYLERYIDVPRKFLFETYEVSNTAQSRSAIKPNGDLKVMFFKEKPAPAPTYYPVAPAIPVVPVIPTFPLNPWNPWGNPWGGGTGLLYNNSEGLSGQRTVTTCSNNTTVGTKYNNGGTVKGSGTLRGGSSSSVTMDSLSLEGEQGQQGLAGNETINYSHSMPIAGGASASYYSSASNASSAPLTYTLTSNSASIDLNQYKAPAASNKIETGRVEAGGSSNQAFQYVSKEFYDYAFHTIIFKLLPLSQKTLTSEDVNVRRYCCNCGAKQKAEWKFCPSCSCKV